MTSGDKDGTSGWAWAKWRPWLFILAVGIVIVLVNATSVILEEQRDGDALAPWKPFLWEASSFAVILGLAPLVGEAIRRLPPRRDNWPRFLLGHAALTVAFSAVHVAGMVAIRKAGYALAGAFYDFSHGALARELFYEWRKDVLTYAVLAATYFVFQRYVESRAPQAEGDQRIEIRDGGTAVFLAPADILFLEAAGNYVEFHVAARSHLVRGTLATWEAKLAQRGFVRAHRSRLINRARISALKPTPSGDVEITLDDGRMLLGSRRYRAKLDAAAAPGPP